MIIYCWILHQSSVQKILYLESKFIALQLWNKIITMYFKNFVSKIVRKSLNFSLLKNILIKSFWVAIIGSYFSFKYWKQKQ